MYLGRYVYKQTTAPLIWPCFLLGLYAPCSTIFQHKPPISNNTSLRRSPDSPSRQHDRHPTPFRLFRQWHSLIQSTQNRSKCPIVIATTSLTETLIPSHGPKNNTPSSSVRRALASSTLISPVLVLHLAPLRRSRLPRRSLFPRRTHNLINKPTTYTPLRPTFHDALPVPPPPLPSPRSLRGGAP